MINVIGLAVPKIISLLTIVLSSIPLRNKLLLVLPWFVHLIISYDIAKPGHKGKLYQLVPNASFEVAGLFVECVRFLPAVMFLIATILFKAWLPFVPGVVRVLFSCLSMIEYVKDMCE